MILKVSCFYKITELERMWTSKRETKREKGQERTRERKNGIKWGDRRKEINHAEISDVEKTMFGWLKWRIQQYKVVPRMIKIDNNIQISYYDFILVTFLDIVT